MASNPINVNGRTLGTSDGQDQDYEARQENQRLLSRNPTDYSKAASEMLKGDNRVRSATYPLNGGNSHYIRFFINLSEESKLLQLFKIGVDKTADLTGQNRGYRNTTDQIAVDTAMTGGAGAAGATIGAAVVGKTAGIGMKTLFKQKIGAGTQAAATGVGLVGGAAAGASAGNTLGDLASEYLKVTNKLKRLAANITLYTPSNIYANYNLNYDMPEDLLVVLAQSENFEAAKAGLAALGSPMSDLSEGSLSDKDKWAQSGNAAGKFGRILATGASKTVSMLSRTAVNKRKDVMFTHVGNRTFRFNYTFAPRSVAEANEVNEIIFLFKYFAHPEMLPGYGNFLYLYPAEFDIEYGIIPNNPNSGAATHQQNKYLNKISSCVLVDIEVNYAPMDSFQSLEQGEPVLTTMSLKFMEIEQLHRDRIGEGY